VRNKKIYTFAPTVTAILGLGFVLSTGAITCATNNILRAGKPCSFALEQLLQRNLIRLLFIWALCWSSPPHTRHSVHIRHATAAAAAASSSHVEHLSQYIIQIYIMTVSATGAALECRHAVRVVHMPLLVILKDFVGCLDSFEALLRLCSSLLGMFVRVT
jgi:hypothetical protein